ncbi:MAG: UbiA-like protein EboC [Tatlockia sp.]|jgi:4-hydroxybenzoate polyprenyltransferase
MDKVIHYLQFVRPANIITALADILAGFSIAYASTYYIMNEVPHGIYLALFCLLLATAFLYAGGIIMNDVFDAKTDAIERPERIIPSGKISKDKAIGLGLGALVLGIVAAFFVSWLSGLLALFIALFALSYDGLTKDFLFLGPFNMALCRALNLCLGISIVMPVLALCWYLAFIPLFYIIAVTLISKGEVHGGNNRLLKAAFVFYVLAILSFFVLNPVPPFHPLSAALFILFLVVVIFRSLMKALTLKTPETVRHAVKKGILGLIILDAAFVAGYVGFGYGVIMLVLLMASLRLGKRFAVT